MNPKDTTTGEATKVASRTVADGIPVGDGRIPPGNTIIVGKRKSGKTVLLRTIIDGRVACDDAVTWVVTPCGLHSAAYLAGPWQTGHALDRHNVVPPVDWVATTSDEITDVLNYAGRIASHRRIDAVPVVLRDDTPTLPPSPTWPNLTVIVDDADQLTGDQLDAVARLFVTGRAVGVNVVLAVPDLTVVPPVLRANVQTIVFTTHVDNPQPGAIAAVCRDFAPARVGEHLIVTGVDTGWPASTTVMNTALRSVDIRGSAGKKYAGAALNRTDVLAGAPRKYQRRAELGSGAALNALARDAHRRTGG